MAQTSRSVGASMPVSGAPSRWPLVGFSVPTSSSVFAPLAVKAVPAWQAAQFRLRNSVLPSLAAVVSVVADGRNGVSSKRFSEAT